MEMKHKILATVVATAILIVVSVVCVIIGMNVGKNDWHPTQNSTDKTKYSERIDFYHQVPQQERHIPWTYVQEKCATLLRFSNVTSVNVTCFIYPDDVVKTQVQMGDQILTMGAASQLIKVDNQGRMVARPMAEHEEYTITRYWSRKKKSLWWKQRRRFPPMGAGFKLATDKVIIKNNSFPIWEDYLYQFRQLTDNPAMILFREFLFVKGFVARYPGMPSLVIEPAYALLGDPFLLHGPGYFEVVVADKRFEQPPKVRPWSKKVFQEMRTDAEKRGELESFDSMVELLRVKGIPPPST